MNQLLQLLLHSREIPRVVDRRTHAALDYLTTGYFFCLAGMFWGRHRRASATALINGLMLLGVSLFTDYPGSLSPIIPFETHGKLDVVQAATAAGLPVLLGFSGDRAATPFHTQAINELFVIAITDWRSGRDAASQSWRRAS